MKNKLMLALALCCLPLVTGCAGCMNDIRSRGSILGSTTGDYIVISQSGGLIMDCWKLNDVYVQNEENSDGWLFTDDDGNVVRISGDCKVIRISDMDDMDNWHEYHMESESMTYREKFNEELR